MGRIDPRKENIPVSDSYSSVLAYTSESLQFNIYVSTTGSSSCLNMLSVLERWGKQGPPARPSLCPPESEHGKTLTTAVIVPLPWTYVYVAFLSPCLPELLNFSCSFLSLCCHSLIQPWALAHPGRSTKLPFILLSAPRTALSSSHAAGITFVAAKSGSMGPPRRSAWPLATCAIEHSQHGWGD